MNKTLAVLRREFIETVRTKAFAISTVLVPVFMGVMLFLPQMLADTTPDVLVRMAVLDRTGKLYEAFEAEMASDPSEDFLTGGERRYVLSRVPPEMAGGGSGIERPGDLIDRMGAGVLIEIEAGVMTAEGTAIYYSSHVADRGPIRRVEKALNRVLPRARLAGTSFPVEQIDMLAWRLEIESRKIGEGGVAEERSFMQEWMLPLTFATWLYASTLMAGMALSRGLLEEKASRIVEVLVSSVTPFQLMTGKILGQALVILSQFTIWMLMGAALYIQGSGGEQARDVLSAINAPLLIYLGIYFILGYFLYASLFAAVGAVCTTELEAQQTQTPLVLLVVVPLVVAIAIVRAPDSPMAVALSMIPFFSPSVMMMRLAVQAPPGWQVATSLLILVISILIITWAVSRVFRVAILMTGKRMTLPEILKWLRTA